MIKVEAVIIDPYVSEPPWIDDDINYGNYIALNSKSTTEDISMFFAVLFDYKQIEYGENINDSFKNFLNAEYLVVSGGPRFSSEDKSILPSCCCGLEELNDVFASFEKGTSPWLGHDPNPGIEYFDDGTIKVWSDAPDSKDAKFIKCTTVEFTLAWQNMKEELNTFIEQSCRSYLETIRLSR